MIKTVSKSVYESDFFVAVIREWELIGLAAVFLIFFVNLLFDSQAFDSPDLLTLKSVYAYLKVINENKIIYN